MGGWPLTGKLAVWNLQSALSDESKVGFCPRADDFNKSSESLFGVHESQDLAVLTGLSRRYLLSSFCLELQAIEKQWGNFRENLLAL